MLYISKRIIRRANPRGLIVRSVAYDSHNGEHQKQQLRCILFSLNKAITRAIEVGHVGKGEIPWKSHKEKRTPGKPQQP
jgi:hypothetical protein